MKPLCFYFFLLIFGSNLCNSQDLTAKYVFPIHPGDKIWKETRYPERVKMLSIPDNIIKNLSDVQLIGACIEYPFYINLFAFNSLDEGFQNLSTIFNGYEELLSRSSSGTTLMDFYSNMSTTGFSGRYSVYNNTFNPLKFYLLEYILSRDEIIKKLNNIQKKQLYYVSREKYFMKKNCTQRVEGELIFSNSAVRSTMLIICKLVISEGQAVDSEISTFCQDIIQAKSIPASSYDKIISKMDKFYK